MSKLVVTDANGVTKEVPLNKERVTIGRAPYRSSSRPTGICMAPYTASWMTANIDSAEASASNRTAASTPTDDSDVRLVTDST